MPNIKQQKKRVRTAGQERLENLRYRSTIKTLTKRLATLAEEGDTSAVETEHRNLVKWIDRAVARGALHRNTGARRKSQAARLAAGAGTAIAEVEAAPAAPAKPKSTRSRQAAKR